VKIWDSMTGREIVSFAGHTNWVASVVFSPDGQRLASGSHDNTVKIWGSVSGKELFSLKGHADRVESVAFSPDGLRLASGSNDSTVKIWDSATGKELFSLKSHAGTVLSVSFSPDGRRLAAGIDGMLTIWETSFLPKYSVAGQPIYYSIRSGRNPGPRDLANRLRSNRVREERYQTGA
jgi:WD40 repeat protein